MTDAMNEQIAHELPITNLLTEQSNLQKKLMKNPLHYHSLTT